MTTSAIQSTCPYCGKFLDSATGGEDKRPRPGSLSICIECFQPSVFNEQMEMERLDWSTLSLGSQLQLREFIRLARARITAARIR